MKTNYLETFINIKEDLLLALKQTFYMVGTSLIFAVIIGGLFGLVLYLSETAIFYRQKFINQVIGALMNMIRSTPFLILMIFLLPLSKIIVGTKIGPEAVVPPLTIAAIAFFARLAEASFKEVDKGVIEAAVSSGASTFFIIRKLLIKEALSSLIRNVTVTLISILGFSAMAGLVGGGGLGDLAYRYGYQRYEPAVMLFCVIILIVLVQIFQSIGDYLAKAVDKR